MQSFSKLNDVEDDEWKTELDKVASFPVPKVQVVAAKILKRDGSTEEQEDGDGAEGVQHDGDGAEGEQDDEPDFSFWREYSSPVIPRGWRIGTDCDRPMPVEYDNKALYVVWDFDLDPNTNRDEIVVEVFIFTGYTLVACDFFCNTRYFDMDHATFEPEPAFSTEVIHREDYTSFGAELDKTQEPRVVCSRILVGRIRIPSMPAEPSTAAT